MAPNIEWYLEKVAQLSVESERQEVLSELKTAIFSLKSAQLRSVAQQLKLDLIFDCLNSSDKNQIREACDVLYPLISSFEPIQLLNEYENSITRALAHPSPKLRALVLKELCRIVRHSSSLAERICREDVLLSILETIGGGPGRSPECDKKNDKEDEEEEQEENSAGRAAVHFMCTIGRSPYGVALLSPGSILLVAMKEQSKRSDIVRYRVYEVLVEIATYSRDGLSNVVDSGLLNPMLEEALGESVTEGSGVDLLAQANALQLLGQLAVPEHGARYVDGIGIADKLARTLAQANEDVLASSLLLPGLLKFFGGIGHIRPKEVLSSYPAFASSLFEAIFSCDVSVVGVAMETVGYVGMTPKGKQALYSLCGVQMAKVMRRLGEMMIVLPTPQRVRALNSLSCLLTLKPEEQDKELLAITQRWFEGLCPTKPGSTQWASAELVASICRQPFPELELAGLQVFQCLAILPWGQRMIASCPGLLEFLTSNNSEEGRVRESKHSVSKALLNSPTSPNSLSESQLSRLETFVQAGPHGKIIGPTEVAVDGAS